MPMPVTTIIMPVDKRSSWMPISTEKSPMAAQEKVEMPLVPSNSSAMAKVATADTVEITGTRADFLKTS